MTLELKINSVSLELGGPINTDALDEVGFQKAGTLRRLIKQLPGGQTMYSAVNCKMEVFAEEFYPCTHGYLNRDRQWETRAAIYVADGKVQKLEFKVIEGQYSAANFLERFQEGCRATLGEPEESSRFTTRWVNGSAQVTSTLHRDMINVDFLMEITAD
jgi:hypothetical protein